MTDGGSWLVPFLPISDFISVSLESISGSSRTVAQMTGNNVTWGVDVEGYITGELIGQNKRNLRAIRGHTSEVYKPVQPYSRFQLHIAARERQTENLESISGSSRTVAQMAGNNVTWGVDVEGYIAEELIGQNKLILRAIWGHASGYQLRGKYNHSRTRPAVEEHTGMSLPMHGDCVSVVLVEVYKPVQPYSRFQLHIAAQERQTENLESISGSSRTVTQMAGNNVTWGVDVEGYIAEELIGQNKRILRAIRGHASGMSLPMHGDCVSVVLVEVYKPVQPYSRFQLHIAARERQTENLESISGSSRIVAQMAGNNVTWGVDVEGYIAEELIGQNKRILRAIQGHASGYQLRGKYNYSRTRYSTTSRGGVFPCRRLPSRT
ncbi:hypothetical protein MRB53_012296 [Persea americana]|uniref:Uncharacterized protein n=1 Tax=Persea americana TaxID=3435 RepID=A0ACC2LXF1_PERAE|nr:hypothetical protein MRB53_012296 [Persea americana]